MNIPENLTELQIVYDDDYIIFISQDDEFELHLKRNPNSCFINKYLNDRLKAVQSYMDIQPVFS